MVDQQKPLRNFKTIIVGKSGVGKSAILLRYVQGQFVLQHSTIAVDYRFKKVDVNGNKFNLQMWDTAGQQRYKTIVYSFFKLSKAACVVFDLNDQKSLSDVDGWMEQLNIHCGSQIPKIVLGNKSDLLNPTDLQKQLNRIRPTIDRIKQQFDCQFFLVSAKNGENIQKAFNYLATKLNQQIKRDIPEEVNNRRTFKLEDQKIKPIKKRDKCCH